MAHWVLTETNTSQGRTFQRPLDPIELSFLWDGRFNGTADTLRHVELRLLNTSRDAHLFSDANIVKAWLSTKRRHPLAGATIQVLPGKPVKDEWRTEGRDTSLTVHLEPHFVVNERDLTVLRPHEIVFGNIMCAEEVFQRMAAFRDGPRLLSENLLVQLHLFRETDPHRSDTLHLMVLIAHCVSDAMAARTFMRCFLDTLASGGESDLEPAQIPLEERLEMLVPSAVLMPIYLRSLSPETRRWRQAVGAVILQLRMAKRKGGHTLPCRRTRITPYTPAQSRFVSTLLTQAQTTTVLDNCRLHGLKFGSAYLTLAQVAMTRMLYRRYLRGEISEEEWEYRKTQPHLIAGSLGLRQYLDKSWYNMGGGGEFKTSINVIFHQLPFMTLGETKPHQYREEELLGGAPPFSDLLTFDRFVYRAGLIKKQEQAFINHPMFYELLHATGQEFARRALQTMQHRGVETANGTGMNGDDEDVLAVTDIPLVNAHSSSTLGNVELTFPTEYPLPPSHPLSPFASIPHPARAGYSVSPREMDTTPRIVAEDDYTLCLHTRPGELYLYALTSRGRMRIDVFYDGNVFEDEVVREWLDEIKEAVLWYLGQMHPARPR